MRELDTNAPGSAATLAGRALHAWSAVRGGRPRPTEVTCLQAERARFVLRLRGVGPGGSHVIAKRCQRLVAIKEATVYQRILPRLPQPGLRFHGFHAEDDSGYAWVFVEDAEGEPYDPTRTAHRAWAGRWLGRLHAASAALPDPAPLVRRGPRSFRHEMKALFDAAERAARVPGVGSTERTLLESVVSGCRRLGRRWGDLEAACRGLPSSLVHGDFKEDHIRIRRRNGSAEVLLFDWHESGWGPPVLDLAKFLGYSVAPDVDAYRNVFETAWPRLSESKIRRLGYAGEACRCVASIRWELERLAYGMTERALATLVVYSDWLAEIIRAEPWLAEASAGPRARRPRARTWY